MIIDDLAFKPDLLVIDQIKEKDTRKVVNHEQRHIVDLGWSPEGDVNGEYYLTVLQGNRNNVKLNYANRDRFVMQQAINFCLRYINEQGSLQSDFENKLDKILHFSDIEDQTTLLMPLKVFSRIAVLKNTFYDMPINNYGLPSIEGADDELLLLKKADGRTKPGYSWEFDSYAISLKRIDHQDKGSMYLLEFFHDNDGLLFEHRHQDRFVIQSAINFCLETISIRGLDNHFEEEITSLIKNG